MKIQYLINLSAAICLAIILLWIPHTVLSSSTEYLDLNFGPPRGYVSFEGFAQDTAIQSNGDILSSISGVLVRLSAADGSIDTSFGWSGAVTLHPNSSINVALTPDGKIYIVGVCSRFGPPESNFGGGISLMRLLSNGWPDNTFNNGEPVCADFASYSYYTFISLGKIIVQGDGKPIIHFTTTWVGDGILTTNYLVRFDTNGMVDPTFGENGTVHVLPSTGIYDRFPIYNILPQEGGKILLVGSFQGYESYGGYESYDSTSDYLVVVQLTISGQYDTTFSTDGIFTYNPPNKSSYGNSIAVQNNGRIIVGGSDKDSSYSITSFLLGLTDNGEIDTGFGTNGWSQIPETAEQLLTLPNDRIITSGYQGPNAIIRMFNKDGFVDTTFADGGMVIHDSFGYISGLDMEPNGQIVVTSSKWLEYAKYRTYIARMATDIGPKPIFADVSFFHWAWDYIEHIYSAGVTGGCSASPLIYCPDELVTRAQMAVFLERGMAYPSSFSPPNVAPTFGDTVGHWAEDWIEALKNHGVTAGCATGLYCPENPVTRAQMAVFLLKAKYGSSYVPPSVGTTTGFGDVPTTYWAAAWIKQLAAEQITGGCGNGNYCPENPVTRAQMAVFLVKTFNLP